MKTETIEDKYFTFIDDLNELGKAARNEQSSSNFSKEDEPYVTDSIDYFKTRLLKLVDQINLIEAEANELYK